MHRLKEIDKSHSNKIYRLMGWKIDSFDEIIQSEMEIFPIDKVKMTLIFERPFQIDNKLIINGLIKLFIIEQ